MYLFALQNEELSGVFNAVAPKPVTNKELTIRLADILKRKFYVPVYVPSFVLKIALGEMSQEVLKSTTVCSDKIRKSGFDYTFPTIESALAELTQKN
jgi:NAD dependent epimerase/dehydratase family enzyme